MVHYQEMVGLDFETYSAVDLTRHGLQRYIESPHFQPLIARACWYDGNDWFKERFDFTRPDRYHHVVQRLREALRGKYVVAHNAGFEQRVLDAIGIKVPSERFIDSAVIARAAGAAGRLEAAAPQLLNSNKLETGSALIRLFCVPGKYQEANDNPAFDRQIVDDNPLQWDDFGDYCQVDADLGLKIALQYPDLVIREQERAAITMDMNQLGWHVDVKLVEEMQRRYLENQAQAVADFVAKHNAGDLNINSYPQLKTWCEARGIKARSFDEKAVAGMITRLENRLFEHDLEVKVLPPGKVQNYTEVLDLLRTKQILGGSSLKKLKTILDTVGKDCRLRDQYQHIGAGQSYRTTGIDVQMQNLKRLKEVDDVTELFDDDVVWSNDQMAGNLRQCFTATDRLGFLIVGDFSSVESRGLAWQAGADWKLRAFRNQRDLYKVQAEKIFGVDYDMVTKEQRQTGKVGELSCGYQAGAGAVQSFAEKMGVRLTEGEATKLVSDWRDTNPEVVAYWAELDEALCAVVDGNNALGTVKVGPRKNYTVNIYRTSTPASLRAQNKDARSIEVAFLDSHGSTRFTRVFHGVYRRGRQLVYYKPSKLKSGDLWRDTYVDQKTKQRVHHSIYGGKLAGIVTQSLCRELFFEVLQDVHDWTKVTHNARLVGQFHDEIVLDWAPGRTSLAHAEHQLQEFMEDNHWLAEFPLGAEIKHDYRYTK